MSGMMIAAVMVGVGLLAGVIFLFSPRPKAVPVPARAKQVAAPPDRGSRRAWLGASLGGALALAVAAGVLYAYQPASSLPEGHPPIGEGAPLPTGDDPLSRTLALAKANPQDLDMAAFAAHELIRRERFDEADALIRSALAIDPNHLESRIHQAVADGKRGDKRLAIAKLRELGAVPDPLAAEAHLFRGALALEVDDRQAALESFEQFTLLTPEEHQPKQLQHILAALRGEAPPPAGVP
jgi:tetratricopeptide (TPR) repeat protein